MIGLGPRWRKRLSEVMATYLWLWSRAGPRQVRGVQEAET